MTKELTNPIPLADIERATRNGNTFFARLARQLLASMQREERLREALQYIVDHNWVAGATPVKWIDEFVDVAKQALVVNHDSPNEYPKTPNNEGELS